MDLEGYEQQARAVLDGEVYDYYAGGAGAEVTLRANRRAWQDYDFFPGMLRGVGEVRTATTVLGTALPAPVMVAPSAYHALAHPEGERATIQGVARARSLMIASTQSSTRLEDIAAAAPDARRWFQLYLFEDRGFVGELIDRAVDAGYGAIVATIDVPALGNRRRDVVHGFVPSDRVAMANVPAGADASSRRGPDAVFRKHDPNLTPEILAWITERSELPLVVKGVLRADDALTCVDAGASAIAVSNHGGRQLDRAVPTAHALAEVVAAVEAVASDVPVEVYVDGGVRSGEDVLVALALGARAVLVGRPVLWGLATRGAAGVCEVLTGLGEELELALRLAGVPDATNVPRDLICPSWGRGPGCDR